MKRSSFVEGAKDTRWFCGRCDSERWNSESGLCRNCGVDLRVIQPYPQEYVLVRKPSGSRWKLDDYIWEKVKS